jgi:hypothetical protein
MKTLTQERLKELLHYDPETGVFTWKENRGGATRKGDRAGSQRSGSTYIVIDGKQYYAHNLIFLYMEDFLSNYDEVFCINGIKNDDRWDNLKYIKKENKLTQKRLKTLLHYNPDTGVFIRRITRSHNARIGDIAGGVQNTGYISIGVDRKGYLAHRLAFLYMEGYFPEYQVDHIDRNPSNNKWKNLRHVSTQCNLRNMGMNKNNKSGVSGVYFSKAHGKWRSNISVDNETHYIGIYKTLKEAVKARWVAEVKYGFPNCNTTSTAFQFLQKEGG